MHNISDERALILIIDDSPDIRELLAIGLGRHYQVATAADGISGLEQAIALLPACIIIDVKMPGLDGLQCVRALRGDQFTAEIPLIILTALNQEAQQFSGYASGADRYLTKPIVPSQLLPIIREVVALDAEARLRRMQRLATQDDPAP